jgi:hypothetical protein
MIADGEYVKFSLGGRSMARSRDPLWLSLHLNGEANHAVSWPMRAHADILGRMAQRFGRPIYRTPADPNDCCAPEGAIAHRRSDVPCR